MKLLPTVRKQYEALPYPQRRPKDERTRLITTSLGQLNFVNHLFWSGRRSFDSGFRVLDAGCGTGDATVFMAEQLRKTNARIIALDVSKPSLRITRQRLEERRLANVELVEGPVEEIAQMGLGPFDYIVASGVLHHLASPEEGMRALRDVLKPDGGMGVMLYGQYGRTAIYQMQALFRLIAPPDWSDTKRIAVAKRVLSNLSPMHWASFGAPSWEKELQTNGDAAYIDMFLHAQDRAYMVPELYELTGAAGMQIVRFLAQYTYDPLRYVPALEVGHLGVPDRQAAAELLNGQMGKHRFFLARAEYRVPTPPSPEDESAVPVWTYVDQDNATQSALVTKGKALIPQLNAERELEVNAIERALIGGIDGRSTVRELLAAAATANPAFGQRQVDREWLKMYAKFNEWELIALNRPPS